MNTIAAMAGLLVLALLASEWLGKRSISLPMVFVAAGLVLGPHALGLLDLTPRTELTKELTEVTLGLLLFADASTLRARWVAKQANLITRLLTIGLLLSIIAGGVIALVLFPHAELGLLLLIAAALAPTDAALGLPIFVNPNIPSRIRTALNVESGLNDGIVTPLVTLFIAMTIAASTARAADTDGWLVTAIEEILLAVLIGGLIGIVGGWLIRTALERGWTSPDMARLAFFGVAIAAFFSSGNWEGNRFIAAFVGGLCAGSMLGHHAKETAEYTEVTGSWLSYVVWTIFGAVYAPLAFGELFSWRALLFAVLALTVMRMVPVAIAMIGTGLRPDTVAMMGWFGPRGLASVVFLVTALVALEEAGVETDLLVATMTWTIFLSVFLHGLTASPLGAWYGNRLKGAAATSREFLGDALPAGEVDTAAE